MFLSDDLINALPFVNAILTNSKVKKITKTLQLHNAFKSKDDDLRKESSLDKIYQNQKKNLILFLDKANSKAKVS